MGVLVYILGRTGTGKSYSMRNFPKDKLAVVNIQGKILPFRNSAEIEQTFSDDSDAILKRLDSYAKDYKSIVIDDYQYLMSNEFMRRAFERGYDKFTEIAAHAWNIADKVRSLPSDVIVYIMCHTDTDAEGIERLKTIGKLLDEKIYLEGMSTIVLKTVTSDGKYAFCTQNSGKDTVKSPADMFPGFTIDNDLWYVDQKIREYYGLELSVSEEELKAADESVTVESEKPAKKRRGNRDAKAEADEQIMDTILEAEGIKESEDKPEPLPTRRRRTAEPKPEPKVEPEPVVEAETEPVAEETPRRRRRRV